MLCAHASIANGWREVAARGMWVALQMGGRGWAGLTGSACIRGRGPAHENLGPVCCCLRQQEGLLLCGCTWRNPQPRPTPLPQNPNPEPPLSPHPPCSWPSSRKRRRPTSPRSPRNPRRVTGTRRSRTARRRSMRSTAASWTRACCRRSSQVGGSGFGSMSAGRSALRCQWGVLRWKCFAAIPASHSRLTRLPLS